MDKGVGTGTLCSGERDEGRCVCGRPLDMVSIFVSPTTGGQFELKIASSDNVDYLKRLVSKRLRVPKERICLLYRERHLREGSLDENCIVDGAKITLLPSVETGLLTQRPEQSVMQALESLNDGQVNDFLSGKAPLNLTMRLGDHMMLIQLQLSTVSPNGSGRKSFRSSSSSSSSHPHSHEHHHHHHHHHHYHHYHHTHLPCPGASSSIAGSITPPPSGNSVSASLFSQSPHLQTPSPSFANTPPSPPRTRTAVSPPRQLPSTHRYPHHSSSYPTTPPAHHHHHHHYSRGTGSASQQSSPLDDVPIVRGCPHQILGEEELPTDASAHLDTKALAEASRNLTQTLKQLSSEVLTTKPAEKESSRSSSTEKIVPTFPSAPSLSSSSNCSTVTSTSGSNSSNNSSSSSNSRSSNVKRQGAIIESMHHHGKGVYSGTFSGTLNPALQDRQGRPKRDISTIIHILNDLLCATPQYRRHTSRAVGSSSTLAQAAKSINSTITQVKFSDSKLEERIQDDQQREMDEDSNMDASQVTRTKLEQLRFIMEERRQRRKARREARATPYHTTMGSPSNSSEPTNASTWSSEATTLVAKEVSPKSEKEKEDANTLLEINTGTVVA